MGLAKILRDISDNFDKADDITTTLLITMLSSAVQGNYDCVVPSGISLEEVNNVLENTGIVIIPESNNIVLQWC